MKKMKIVTILIIAAFTFVVLFAGCAELIQDPTIQITQPEDGADLEPGSVTISVDISNFDVVNKLGQSNVEGEGHIHYFLDVEPPTTMDEPAITRPGTYVPTTNTSYTWTNIISGQHNFSVELVNNDHTPLSPPVVETVTVQVGEGQDYDLISGWYQGEDVEYYDFGALTPLVNGSVLTAPIYVFRYGENPDGTPDVVPGQHNIIDVVPGDDGYSDLWQVHFVTVPSDYTVDSIRSVDHLMTMNYDIVQTDVFVNCPIVPAGSTFETDITPVQGWYKNQMVYYPDFGSNPTFTAPIYVLITGMDMEGNPITVDGQRNIIDVLPEDEEYSDFWRVHFVTVPDDYTVNSITSADALMDMDYPITLTDVNVNCPVVETPDMPSENVTINLSAMNNQFNKSVITVPAGANVIVEFSNQDNGIPHNFAVYESADAETSIFIGDIITGEDQTTYTFTAPSTEETYFFRCDVHPVTMIGDFIVQ